TDTSPSSRTCNGDPPPLPSAAGAPVFIGVGSVAWTAPASRAAARARAIGEAFIEDRRRGIICNVITFPYVSATHPSRKSRRGPHGWPALHARPLDCEG